MLQQLALPFKYEATTTSGATALAGLPLVLELARVVGLRKLVEAHVPARCGADGWSDADMLLTLVLLNLAGGDCVSDLELLRRDEGFVKVARAVACSDLTRQERRAKMRRLAKSNAVPLPSASSVFRFLASFHGAEQQVERVPGTAVLVAEHERLQGMWQVSAGLLAFMQRHRPCGTVTIDADATLIETHKAEALSCYKGYKAYQPLNFFVFEWNMVAYSHFRDGNVPCGYRQLDSLKRALELLPAGIGRVRVRMDTQGYEWELLRYMAEGTNERFGVIEFVVGADMTHELKKEIARLRDDAWHDLEREPGQVKQQWAEVCFVPKSSATQKNGPSYRFVAIREVLAQQSLPGLQADLPFPTLEFPTLGHCKLHAVVTNTALDGPELIAWYRERCGKSEQAHAVMKTDLAGGKLPSADFGENAAWWSAMLLALNINEILKQLAMGEAWATKRIKAIRAHLIGVAGRVVEHARQLVVRLSAMHPSTALIQLVRARILALAPAPSG